MPVDPEELLEESFNILAEMAFSIRCSSEDLEKERGPVLDERRQTQTAMGRASEAQWQFLFEGSKYAERLPIGTENIIRTCSATTIKNFYCKWYTPKNMAIIAVGDFKQEPGQVVELIRSKFEPVGPLVPAPHVEVPPYQVCRFYLCC